MKLRKKEGDTKAASSELEELRLNLSNVIGSCKEVYEEYQGKRASVITMRKRQHLDYDYNKSVWGGPVERPETQTQGPQPQVYYRALYDFYSANPDELSFSVGAIIQVSFHINVPILCYDY